MPVSSRLALLSVVALSAGLVVACEEEPEAVLRPEPPPASAPAASPPAPPPGPAGPWAVRTVLSCSEWAGVDAFATATHVFGCDGAIFDRASGALIDARLRRGAPIARFGEGTVWRTGTYDEPTLTFRDAQLRPRPAVAMPPGVSLDSAAAGGDLLLRGDARYTDVAVYELDPTRGAARALEGSEVCAGARGLGRTPSGVQCVVPCAEDADRSCLRTVGVDGELPIPAVHGVIWVGDEGRFVARGVDGTARLMSSGGEVLATREGCQDVELRDVSGDALLVAREDRAELWRVVDDALEVELVYGRRPSEGAFAGDEIVLAVSHGLVWLHRGAPRALPTLPLPTPPDGFTALRSTADGESASFEGEGDTYPRGPNDVAAFVARGRFALVVVSRSEAVELSRFDDLEGWASAAAARYVDPGSQRWAKAWRGEAGREMRGHAYIGGCERTHIDVVVRERGPVLERWRVYTSDGEGGDAILGETPSHARSLASVRGDSYEGDPSIGRW